MPPKLGKKKLSNSKFSHVSTKDREAKWNDSLGGVQGIPEYTADNDKYCPRAQMRKFNEVKRQDAAITAKKSKNTTNWVTNVLQTKFENVPLRMKPSLRAKAIGSVNSSDSLAEVEILQKIIVRETLLGELYKLVEHRNDVATCIGEIVELVKAIRFQTVDIIEDIDAWLNVQLSPRPFLYRGCNYLAKIFTDLDFLDGFEEIIERFCFEFKFNPLAYRGGGEIINSSMDYSGRSCNVSKKQQALDAYANYSDARACVDGIEVSRLRNAEKVIQREFDRQREERKQMQQYGYDVPQEKSDNNNNNNNNNNNQTGGRLPPLSSNSQHSVAPSSANLMNQSYFASSVETNQGPYGLSTLVEDSKRDRTTSKQRFSTKKVKQERIAVLTEEANELKAMQSHLEEKVQVMVDDHRKLVERKKLTEKRKAEALAFGKDIAAQHLTVEISVILVDMQDINSKIKDCQRESYFIGLERSRKRKIVQQLQDDLELEKRRSAMQAKLTAKIKEGGILSALKTLNKVSMTEVTDSLAEMTMAQEDDQHDQYRDGDDSKYACDYDNSGETCDNTHANSCKSQSTHKKSGKRGGARGRGGVSEEEMMACLDQTIAFDRQQQLLLRNSHDDQRTHHHSEQPTDTALAPSGERDSDVHTNEEDDCYDCNHQIPLTKQHGRDMNMHSEQHAPGVNTQQHQQYGHMLGHAEHGSSGLHNEDEDNDNDNDLEHDDGHRYDYESTELYDNDSPHSSHNGFTYEEDAVPVPVPAGCRPLEVRLSEASLRYSSAPAFDQASTIPQGSPKYTARSAGNISSRSSTSDFD